MTNHKTFLLGVVAGVFSLTASAQVKFSAKITNLFGNEVEMELLSAKKHILTHQIIYVQFFALENYMINFNMHTEIKSVLLRDFKLLPHPKVIADFIEMYL